MELMEDEAVFTSFGEGAPIDMRMPFSREANKQLRNITPREPNTFIDLGLGIGEVAIKNVRFRDADEEGKLLAYIRHEATEPKVIIPMLITLGVAAAGLYKLKHRHK